MSDTPKNFMIKNSICGAAAFIAGLLIAFGPQFLFKLCSGCGSCCGDGIPTCFWTGRAEIGMGLLMAALGLCLLVFTEPQTQLGLYIGIFLAGLFGLLIPHVIIGGCELRTMGCHRRAFPVLTSICSLVLAGTVLLIWRLILRTSKISARKRS